LHRDLIAFSCSARSVSAVVGCRTESWEALGTTVLLRTYSDRPGDVRAAVGRELDEIDRALERFGSRGAGPLAPSALRFALAAAVVAGAGVDPAARGRRPDYGSDRTRLDFGSTAQAMATDRAAQVGEAAGGDAVLVALGGDIATSGSPPSGWWTVRALDPIAPAAGWTVSMRSGGVATSSLDPPDRAIDGAVWLAASVAARSCVEAKVAAAAVLGLGVPAVGWLDEHRLAARLVARDGTIVTLGGWPDAPATTCPIRGSPW
jgi:thiamine biosynthesis lipoprotein ApbE